ncbi:MAG: hypothetical protein CMN79_03400 [Spirochaetales bacterium]|nr:hypothetical protein [Spirochaetales bacterium]
MFQNYNDCIWNLKSCKKSKDNKLKIKKSNFYLNYIKNEFNIGDKLFKNKISTYRCEKCKCLINKSWFDETHVRKIYSSVYGQHHKGWKKFNDFIKYPNKKYHGSLFKILNKFINVKNYGEYNCPFTGLFDDFFKTEITSSKKKLFYYDQLIQKYLNNKQLAGLKVGSLRRKNKENFCILKKIQKKRKLLFNSKKNITKKFLIIDHSKMIWGENCNYKSINCKVYAENIFNLEVLELQKAKNKLVNKNSFFDLFGIFLTLDHTFNPHAILKFALKNSKFVIIQAHIDPELGRQHLFSITKDFPKFLKDMGIFSVDLTKLIKKDMLGKEIYMLATNYKKYKKVIDKIYNY